MKKQVSMLWLIFISFTLWANGESEVSTGNVTKGENGSNRQLLDMIKAGDSQAAEKTLNLGVNLEYQDENGSTALHAAAETGHAQLTSILIKRGVSVDPIDTMGRTPLFIAVDNEHHEVVSILASAGANLAIQAKNGQSPALLALSSSPSVLTRLFQADTVNTPLLEGNTALHLAAQQGLISHVSALIELGADMNADNSAGRSPLDAALTGNVTQAQISCAVLLLRGGALAPEDENWAYITEPFRLKDYELRFDSGATALHLATEKNHEGMVRYLIEVGAKVDARDQPGNTPLHVAIRKGYRTIASILIGNGANVNARDYSGNTPIHEALTASEGIALTKILLNSGAEVNVKDSSGRTPLHLIVLLSGEPDIAHLLIDNGAMVDIRDMQGNTPLLLAVREDSRALSELFLSEDADIFAKNNQGSMPTIAVLDSHEGAVSWFYNDERLSFIDNEGRSVLHHAVIHKTSLDNLHLLIDAGADQNLRDSNGETPLHYAVKSHLVEHAKALLDTGSNPFLENNDGHSPLISAFENGIDITLSVFENYRETEDQWGNTPLFHAVQWENLPIVEALLAVGVNPNHHNLQGDTALHQAVLSENLTIAVKLIEAGADPDGTNSLGQAAVHIAVQWERTEDVRLLASHGANMDIQDRAGHTPLHMAVQLDDSKICEWLLNFHASPNIRDNHGRTPLFIASGENRVEAIKLLLDADANPSSRDNEGRTALHRAITGKANRSAVTLIDYGADIFAVDADNRSSFDLLLKTDVDMASSIINSKVINRQDNQGNTPLHLAVMDQADSDFIKMLLGKGADKSIRNASRKTAYELAMDLDPKDAEELLE